MQASARTPLCRQFADTRAHAHTQHVMQPVVHSRPKASAMDATAVPRAHLCIILYLLDPTDNAGPPTHKSSYEAISLEARGWKYSRHQPCVAVPVFFLFHRRALRFEPIRRKVRRTRPWCFRACRATRFGPRTQLRRSSSNYLNQVREVKVCPIKNELSSPIFFLGSPNTPN